MKKTLIKTMILVFTLSMITTLMVGCNKDQSLINKSWLTNTESLTGFGGAISMPVQITDKEQIESFINLVNALTYDSKMTRLDAEKKEYFDSGTEMYIVLIPSSGTERLNVTYSTVNMALSINDNVYMFKEDISSQLALVFTPTT